MTNEQTIGMACPLCGSNDSKVTDSRSHEGRIRRRRLCPQRHRYTTYEVLAAEGDALDEAVAAAIEALEQVRRTARDVAPVFGHGRPRKVA